MSRKITDWPPQDRPREKLFDGGAESLTDAELLAIVLRTGNGSTGESALDHARRLLTRFGDLKGVSDASFAELGSVKGVGTAKIAQIKASFELGRRHDSWAWKPGELLGSPEEVYRHFRRIYRNVKREIFYVVLLTNKNRKIREVKISEGSLTASIVHPREVFHPVIKDSAAGVVFVHNHPSGDPAPSREDMEITRRLKEVGQLMGVRVMDHVVVGSDRYFSFNTHGLL